MSSKDVETCYKCSNEASSREHVPPKCIFPDPNDFPDHNFRKNLITVPSCDKHNLKKTKNDEFLMICLASSINVNAVGFKHFSSKIVRALKRKHTRFLKEIVDNPKPVKIITKDGTQIPVLKGEANLKRLNDCFESIIYGLFFNEFGETYNGKMTILNDFILPNSQNQANFIKLINSVFKKDPKATDKVGQNPEIFNFQFTKPDKFGLIALKMTFYGGLNVFASLQPTGSKEPFDLGMALINEGIETVVKIPEGEIRFNSQC